MTKLCVKATEESYTSTRSILLGPTNVVPITVAKVAKIASGEIGQRPISSLCHGLCQTRPLKILLNTRVDYALTPPLALSTLQSKTEQLTELNKAKRRVCV